MEIFIAINLFFVLFVCVCATVLVSKIIKLTNENIKIEEQVHSAVSKINQARYGNFQVKLSEEDDDLNLAKSLNSLFESISDRDVVIGEYREKEKESYNLKEEFIAALTHDLKVPIIAQDKTFDLFLQDKFGKLTQTQEEVILKLKKSNSDLKEMVTSILEINKAENAGVELKIQKNKDVVGFVREVICGFEDFTKTENIKINLYSKKNELPADFDPFQIKRVLNNLISNAIRHSSEKKVIDIRISKASDNFSIEIIDYGEGIDEKEIEKIFNKYYSITNRSRVQSGLGLYLSNKIVKKHGGALEVESKIGEGAVFRIILPVKMHTKC